MERLSLVLVTAPALEPVSLVDAKAFMRVDGGYDDSLTATLITAARQGVEEYLRRSLITQTWKLTNYFHDSRIFLPRGLVTEILEVKSIDSAGVEVVMPSTTYHLDSPDYLSFLYAYSGERVQITYHAGYGELAADVPAAIRHGIMNYAAALYENRGQPLPQQIMDSLSAYRHYAL